jgi:glycosyltransferase involved in cell wall biosynthesis
LKEKWLGKDLRLFLSNMKLYRRCRKDFQFNRPHLIYERYGLYGWAGVKLASEFSIPIILELNTMLSEEQRKRLHYPKLARYFETSILKRVDGVCCPSETLRSMILERGITEGKITITPNGVDFTKFDFRLDPGRIRKRFGLDGKFIVGFVGILTRLWGADTILESARQVLSECDDVHYMIVGDGREHSEIKKFIENNGLSDRFTLTGGVSHSDIPWYIASMDLAIAPYSYKEPFHGSAMKIFEYMAMAKPVSASAQGQIKDLIQNGENGMLIEPDDSLGLAQAILRLRRNSNMMREMGLKARAAVENCTWEANAKNVLAIYRQILKN